jgi:nicotinamide mononucleotide (NMN) deamidase PncC
VGTVWVAVKAGDVVKTKKLQLRDMGRRQNVDNAVSEALNMMYDTLRGMER